MDIRIFSQPTIIKNRATGPQGEVRPVINHFAMSPTCRVKTLTRAHLGKQRHDQTGLAFITIGSSSTNLSTPKNKNT